MGVGWLSAAHRRPLEPSPRGRGRGPSETWEGEGFGRRTACRQGVGVKSDRVKPLTLPPLRGGPRPLSQSYWIHTTLKTQLNQSFSCISVCQYTELVSVQIVNKINGRILSRSVSSWSPTEMCECRSSQREGSRTRPFRKGPSNRPPPTARPRLETLMASLLCRLTVSRTTRRVAATRPPEAVLDTVRRQSSDPPRL